MKKLSVFTSLITLSAFLSCEKETNEIVAPTSEPNTIVLNEGLQAATKGYTLIFEDNFNKGSKLSTNWNLTNRADYNSSKCIYQSGKNKIVKHGNAYCLRIEATKAGNKFNSGHLKSKKSFHPGWNEEVHIKGKVKLIARETVNKKDSKGNLIRKNGKIVKTTRNRNFKDTNNVWPAFWTVNESSWPTKGELDIMEGYSFGGSERYSSNLFYGKKVGKNDVGSKAERHYKNFSSSSNGGWHTYDMFWKNSKGTISITMKVDGKTITTYSNTPKEWDFAKFTKHNLIMNLNIGSDSGIFSKPAKLFDRVYMYVDYVKVEKKKINVKK